MYELARGDHLFDPFWNNAKSGMTPGETHVAQMAGLLGDFPANLIEGGERSGQYFDDKGRRITLPTMQP